MNVHTLLARALTWLRADHDEGGASLVEYALLIALIAVVCAGALSFLGGNIVTTLDSAAAQLG